jgi:hypothetical protein
MKSSLNLLLGIVVCFTVSLPVHAALVAYFPVDSATDTSTVLNDIIDDPSHGAADGTGNNGTGGIINDATRGDVAFSPQGHRYTAGTQDIDLSVGFTWSLWWRSSGVNVNNNEAGADVIIGSRDGSWNKVQVAGTARFFDLGNYDLDDGDWHHIAYTGIGDGQSGTTFAEMWIDGVSVATDTDGSIGNATTENTKLEIGGASKYTEDSDGYFDDVAIWNEVLADQQIIDLSNGVSPLTIPEPSSFALLGLGTIILSLLRRRR